MFKLAATWKYIAVKSQFEWNRSLSEIDGSLHKQYHIADMHLPCKSQQKLLLKSVSLCMMVSIESVSLMLSECFNSYIVILKQRCKDCSNDSFPNTFPNLLQCSQNSGSKAKLRLARDRNAVIFHIQPQFQVVVRASDWRKFGKCLLNTKFRSCGGAVIYTMFI